MNNSSLLKKFNLKITPQRLAIVEELKTHGHMNIEDLYTSLLMKFPSISLATIYKNVNAMVEKIFLSEVKLSNKKAVYELIKEEHSHVVCSKCNSIMDITLKTKEIIHQAMKLSGYELNSSSLLFSGTCPKCTK